MGVLEVKYYIAQKLNPRCYMYIKNFYVIGLTYKSSPNKWIATRIPRKISPSSY
ncbi:hypothetical protein I3760_16G083600 [Carya illinoinensis]|nr:hypothetical protein I3760_16G083600 [Carya illinoinensis]